VSSKATGLIITVFTGALVFLAIGRLSDSNAIIGLVKIFQATVDWFSQDLIRDITSTLSRVFFGFILASLFALAAGIMTGRYARSLSGTVNIFNYLRAITPVALAPFFLVAFGIGEMSKVFLIVWGAFFPIWVNVHIGILNMPKNLTHTAHLFRLRTKEMFFDFYLPAALKAGYPGARVAIGISFILVYISETLGAEHGVGYKLGVAYDTIQIPKMSAALLILGLLGFISDRAFAYVCLRLAPWVSEDTSSVNTG
jgi:NitT/TauT family transport system permease protein